MKFLCDVHISLKVSKRIEQLGHKALHVNTILNKWNTTDSQIMDFVDENDLILITKDQDFRNSFILSSRPKKLIKINLGNISNKELIQIIESLLNTIQIAENDHKSFMIEVFRNTSTILVNE